MPNQEPDQKIDFSHYFDETKNNSSTSSKSPQPINPGRGLQGLVIKMSFGLIRSTFQANVLLVLLSILLLAAAALIVYGRQANQQYQVVKPSPLIHPTIK